LGDGSASTVVTISNDLTPSPEKARLTSTAERHERCSSATRLVASSFEASETKGRAAVGEVQRMVPEKLGA
jgi:hypothetical protein